MKPQLNISIPNPCSANWDAMQTNSIGMHCSSCNKTVVDFTKMNEDEIKSYFVKHRNDKTCGHFKKGQLQFNKTKTQQYFTDLYYDAYLKIKYKAPRFLLLLVLSIVLTMYGCNTPTQGEIMDKEQMIKDSISVMESIKADSIENALSLIDTINQK